MKKRYLFLALAISACGTTTHDAQEAQRRFNADIDALGQQAQMDYFACRFVRHLWHCRDEIWQKQPKPHLPAGSQQREFLERYLDAAERRGALHALKSEGQHCGEVISLDSFFWRKGQEAICSGGERYQIERDSGGWNVKALMEGA